MGQVCHVMVAIVRYEITGVLLLVILISQQKTHTVHDKIASMCTYNITPLREVVTCVFPVLCTIIVYDTICFLWVLCR